MSELRKDPVVNRWVITLDDKSFVPQPEYKIPGNMPERDEVCPFCEGNEDKTGKNILTINGADGRWKVRVIPNNNPYLKVETELSRKGVGMFDVVSGTGANEVIIETPRHNADFDRMETEDIFGVITAYKERMLDLQKDTRLEYTLIFRNRGIKAGAAVFHPHSQLIGLPVVPMRINEELESAKQYFEYKKRCVYCDIIENELTMGSRIIRQTENFILLTPFASRTCFEMWILPKKHMAHFPKIEEKEARDLAGLLKDAVARLNKALGNPSYNYMIHTAPVKAGDLDHFHWHIELLPRVKSQTGFEWGTGFYINPTLPEDVAVFLRNL